MKCTLSNTLMMLAGIIISGLPAFSVKAVLPPPLPDPVPQPLPPVPPPPPDDPTTNSTHGPLVIRPAAQNNRVLLRWNSVSGEVYRLQHSASILSTDWVDVEEPVVSNGTAIEITGVATNPVGFFRLSIVSGAGDDGNPPLPDPFSPYGNPTFQGDTNLHFSGEVLTRYRRVEERGGFSTHFQNVDAGLDVHFLQHLDGRWEYGLFIGETVSLSGGFPHRVLGGELEYSVSNAVKSLEAINEWISENADIIPLNLPAYQELTYGDFIFIESGFGETFGIPAFFRWQHSDSKAVVRISRSQSSGQWIGEVSLDPVRIELTDGTNARDMLEQLDEALSNLLSDFTQGDPWDTKGVVYVNGNRYIRFADDAGGCNDARNQVYYSSTTNLTLEFWEAGGNRNVNVFDGEGRGRLNGHCTAIVSGAVDTPTEDLTDPTVSTGFRGKLPRNEIVARHPNTDAGTASLLAELTAWLSNPLDFTLKASVPGHINLSVIAPAGASWVWHVEDKFGARPPIYIQGFSIDAGSVPKKVSIVVTRRSDGTISQKSFRVFP